jgi:RNA polymerase sigma factor (sigma-70 family)
MDIDDEPERGGDSVELLPPTEAERIKDIRVVVSLKNNQLYERRKKLGYSQAMFAQVLDIKLTRYTALELMKEKPYKVISGKYGQTVLEWSKTAHKLIEYYDCDFEDLFPQAVLNITVTRIEKSVDVHELQQSAFADRLLVAPDVNVEKADLRDKIFGAFDTLDPKEHMILSMRFGLDGKGERTLEEVAKEFGISRNRVRQLESRALRRMRHPARAGSLHTMIDGVERESFEHYKARIKAERARLEAIAAEQESTKAKILSGEIIASAWAVKGKTESK